MAVTFEDINRKVRQEILREMTLEERLGCVSIEDRLNGLPSHELAKAILREELDREPTPVEIDELVNGVWQIPLWR